MFHLVARANAEHPLVQREVAQCTWVGWRM